MSPERAASILRELLQTPRHELGSFSRRSGLDGQPAPGDLEHAQELLQALVHALESGPGPNWQRVTDAWRAMVEKHGPLDLSALGPRPPEWIRPAVAKPALGDPAPGTAVRAATAPPRFVAPPMTEPSSEARRPASSFRTAPLPAQPAPSTAIAESVMTYAAFCAACAAAPERATQTQRDYGIAGDAERARIDAMWQDRFDADEELLRAWEQLFAQFRGSLRR